MEHTFYFYYISERYFYSVACGYVLIIIFIYLFLLHAQSVYF